MTETLYLLDGHAHLYAAYFGIAQRLTSPTGMPTNAVYGVLKVMLRILRERQPTYWAVVLDPDGPVFRNTLDTDYKAHRKPMPDDLVPQPALLRRVLSALGVPTFSVDNYEADDVLATLCDHARAAGIEVYICSKDKDFGQLLATGVYLFDTKTAAVIDAARWTAEWGVRPDQVVDYLSLMGDASDNIPGAKGVGDKTAAKLISQFGSLDALLARTGELKGKQRENIEAFAPQAARSRQLVTLVRDVPLTLDWNALRPAPPLQAAEVMTELGLSNVLRDWSLATGVRAVMDATPAATALPAESLVPPGTPFAALVAKLGPLERLASPEAGRSNATSTAPAEDDPTDFDPDKLEAQALGGLAAAVAATAAELGLPQGRGVTHVINTPDLLAALIDQLRGRRAFALDTETTGLDPMTADLVGLSLAWNPGEAYYLPVRCPLGERPLDWPTTRDALAPVMADASVTKVGQNIKYDLLVLVRHGLPVAGVGFDTMVAAYCLDPARREFGIDEMCRDFFAHQKIPTSDLLGKGKKTRRMDELPIAAVAEYAGEDVDFTWRLAEVLAPQLEPRGVARLFADIEMPLVSVLADMEYHGITVDAAMLGQMAGELDRQLEALRLNMFAEVADPFNPDSPKQVAELLFDKLGLKSGRKTSLGAASTDVEVLQRLADEHPLPALLLEYRQLAKLKNTYVGALPKLINPYTGRVHTKYNQAVAATGRLSSSEPNLQNIPTRTALGRTIRRAFRAGSPDHVLLTADYSQIELRLLAHFSGDENLVGAFAADRDIHRFVAAQLHGIPEEQVTSAQRSAAKTVNFGIIYGQSAHGLARATGMTHAAARAFITDYFARYPKVRRFIDDCIRLTTATGMAPTVLGRQRRVEAIFAGGSQRGFGERLAVNTVLQGSAADLLKTAMVAIARRLREENRPSRMVLTIHDELLFETPLSALESDRAMIVDEMTRAMTLTVPLKVDVAWGANWLEVGD